MYHSFHQHLLLYLHHFASQTFIQLTVQLFLRRDKRKTDHCVWSSRVICSNFSVAAVLSKNEKLSSKRFQPPKVTGHIYHRPVRCTLCGRCFRIVFNSTNKVQYKVLYLERRLHLYTLALTVPRSSLARIFPVTASFFFFP